MYDTLLAVLYSWSMFQAYVYEAKVQAGILLLILVIVAFTLLIRSYFSIIFMNLLLFANLFWIFNVPVIRQAGSYIELEPYVSMFGTFILAAVQSIIFIPVILKGHKFIMLKYQYQISLGVAVLVSVILTLLATSAR